MRLRDKRMFSQHAPPCVACTYNEVMDQKHTISLLDRHVNDLGREVDLLKKKASMPLELMTLKRYVSGEAVELYRDGQLDMLVGTRVRGLAMHPFNS